MREKKREKYLEAEHWSSRDRFAICDLRSATRGKRHATMRGKRRATTRGRQATTIRRGRRAAERAALVSDVTISPWVWFALGLGFGLLYIGFFYYFFIIFFIFINTSVLQYWVMGFGLLLLCIDCIEVWFSLPTT